MWQTLENFNQYLNEIRLEYACTLLLYTNQTITDIYMNAGFESQRTFNRVFLEEYHMCQEIIENKTVPQIIQHLLLGTEKR